MISLVCTVLNEKNSLPAWLASIREQTVEPDEIVIVDGGSSDGTWEFLTEQASLGSQLKVFQDKGNIAHGRNRAIQEAVGEYIVVTDAGCTYDKSWFAKISAPLVAGQARCVATGFGPGITAGDSALTIALASATTPAPHEFSQDWLPSSRSVAFNQDVWHTVGGYPEWLDYSEDVVFDLKIKETTEIFYIREALVFWRPRATALGFVKQLFHYTHSEAHARLNTHRQIIRYGSYALGVLLAVSGYKWVLLVAACAYFYKFWRRATSFSASASAAIQMMVLVLTPVCVVLGDIAKMAGWLVGICERKTRKPHS